jgi:multiple sugar transport system ATP-binding protein
MDEPLSNLDAKMRVQTRTDIAKLQQDLGVTTVYVTHDQVEAMTMGDRVAVMKDGLLQQVDTPLAIYDRPVNLFVAGFIGSPSMNLLSGSTFGAGIAVVDGHEFPISPEAAAAATSDQVTIGIRPEAWRVAADGETGFPVQVTVVEELGADAYLYATPVATGSINLLHQVVVRIPGRLPLRKGETVRLVADPARIAVFDTATGVRLSA